MMMRGPTMTVRVDLDFSEAVSLCRCLSNYANICRDTERKAAAIRLQQTVAAAAQKAVNTSLERTLNGGELTK